MMVRWLQAGAFVVGVGAALVAWPALASADSESGHSAKSAASVSSRAAPPQANRSTGSRTIMAIRSKPARTVATTPARNGAPLAPAPSLVSSALVGAAPRRSARTASVGTGPGITVSPELSLVDGAITGQLNATSSRGLPLTVTSLGPGSNGGSVDVGPAGAVTFRPYATWLDFGGEKATEEFRFRISEVTKFDALVSRVPVVGPLFAGLIAGLQQVPVVNELLAPIIGSSKVSTVSVDVAALAPGDTPVLFTYRHPPLYVGTKPGLFSSDWLRVNAETGEFNGDEPLMVTIRVRTTIGKAGSTSVDVVPQWPGQLGSGVDAGTTIGIPDSTGDIWFDNVKPLSMVDVTNALTDGSPVQVPVQLTATLMFEGDFSNKYLIGSFGTLLGGYISENLGKQLENIEITATGDAAALLSKTISDLKSAAMPSALQITNFALAKILDWISAGGDPDDLVGASITALVPVDDDLADLLRALGGPAALELDSSWTRVDTEPVRVFSFDSDVQVRSGLLVGGKQSWETTYAGSYLENDWANYTVGTDAWREISW